MLTFKESQTIEFKENHISKPFNPLIANMFYKAGFVESWGKGTNNMVSDCIKVNMLEPSYEYVFQAVKVTFYKTTPKDVGINVGTNNLFEFIEENQPVRVSSMKEYFKSVTTRTLERWIKQLKENNKIEFQGSKKTGGYITK